jgi:hypothetical protein
MEEHRELCRRQHSILAAYAMHVCWVRSIRVIYVSRESLEKYLCLDRFRWERKWWIEQDIKPYFAKTLEDDINKLGKDGFDGMWWLADDVALDWKTRYEIRDDKSNWLFEDRKKTLNETEIIAFLTSVAIGFYPKVELKPSSVSN